ncbi:MAG: cobalamin biosynthesis protein CobN [Methanomethylophilus alvi]|nr:MAG: cobalamin biosynthesis protein CobN [Methanomethylophilus alvi]
MKMRIVVLSLQTADAKVLASPAEKLRELGIEPDVYAINAEEADDDVLAYKELEDRTEQADFVYFRCMSDTCRFKRFDRYRKALEKCPGWVLLFSGNAEVTLMNRGLFRGSDGEYREICRYAASRGPENDWGMVLYAAHGLGKTDSVPPEPKSQRKDGIYHKGMDRNIPKEEYLKTLDPSKMTVGILFASTLWVYDNLAAIDALTDEIERRGMNALPVFFSAVSYKTEGEEGTKATFRKYFLRDDGSPMPDTVLVHTSFSVMYNSRDGEGVRIADADNYYASLLGVPMIHTMTITGDYADYETEKVGLGKHEITNNVAFPEIDGDIIAVPIAYTPKKSGMKRNIPIPDRIEAAVDLAYRWARLRHIPEKDKRVAILLWQSRANSGVIGNAAGLDSVESIAGLLRRMKDEGYTVENVPENGKALISEILDNVTNDLDSMSLETVRKKAAALMDRDDYLKEYSEVPEWDRSMMEKDWGAPPGEICTDGRKIIIPGLVKGNVFIGYQPLRGMADKFEQSIHDPLLFAQHQYLAYYRWIRDVFKADIIIHVGTHGTLEWLPGKNVGLSAKCDPDIVLGNVPNLYIYIIDDPGEGIQCKRRAESVLDGHMPPSMARAGRYDDIAKVEVPLQEYFRNKGTNDAERRREMVKNIYEAARDAKMLNDLGLADSDPGPEGFEPYIVKLHDYISEVKDALVRADLHVLGKAPEGKHFLETVYSLMRLDNGDVRSLRDAFAEDEGTDIQKCISDPSGSLPSGELNSAAVDRIDAEVQGFISFCDSVSFDEDQCLAHLRELHGKVSDDLKGSVHFMCSSAVPNVRRMSDEMQCLLDGMDGKYILPGPSGAPTRGNADILPTGRNYYSLDPDTVPTKASWEIGKRMADEMIDKYVAEKGEYPREVGFIIWATDTMKTGGDDMAYILWLMGVKPVWSSAGGQVVGLEPVPLSELGRPRIDVTVNITGLFRDTFPNLIDMIDDAVKIVAALDEDDEDNALAANLRKDIVDGIAAGLTPDEARRRNSVRIFGAPPGGYGTGVNKSIETGAWKDVKDLADVYIDWCSNGYEKGNYGQKMRDEFVKRFSKVGVTVKNMPDREIDLLDCDDVYEYLGGMNAFVRAYGRKDAVTFMGDGSDPKRTKVRSTKDELRFVFRSKVLNPKFINGLKEHGYRGAAEMANITEYTMAWGATSDVAEDWMYEGLTDKFLDEDTRKWMEEVNPYAEMNILNRLQEAIDRGLWNASEEYRQKIKDLYLESEERIEELTDR